MEVQTISGFDCNECFIRVYVSAEMSELLREANKTAMAALPEGSQEPFSTGPLLDLSKFPVDVQFWIIDGLHRVTALKNLIKLHPDRAKRYSKVNAVFYTYDVLPQVLVLSLSSNLRSETHVPEDNLGKITYYKGLLDNYTKDTGIDVSDITTNIKWPPITIWVYKHLGKSALLKEGTSPTSQGRGVSGFKYCGQWLHVAAYCTSDLIVWFTQILDEAETSQDEVSPNPFKYSVIL
jgi:hypothetical protein